MASATRTIVCDNHYHRGTTVEVDGDEHDVEFEVDAERSVAVAEVPEPVAEALLEQESYYAEGDADEGGDEETVKEAPSAIDGIGPAYEEDLAEAGIETVEDLAEADAEAVAEETDLDADDVSKWIGAAKARL